MLWLSWISFTKWASSLRFTFLWSAWLIFLLYYSIHEFRHYGGCLQYYFQHSLIYYMNEKAFQYHINVLKWVNVFGLTLDIFITLGGNTYAIPGFKGKKLDTLFSNKNVTFQGLYDFIELKQNLSIVLIFLETWYIWHYFFSF